jgi:hypothetical protein
VYQQPAYQQPPAPPVYQQPAYQQPAPAAYQQPVPPAAYQQQAPAAYHPQQPVPPAAYQQPAYSPNVVVDADGDVTVMDEGAQHVAPPANPAANELLRSIMEERERQMKAQGLK